MHLSMLTRRHLMMLAVAALVMAAGIISAVLMRGAAPEPLDRAALSRLAADAAAEPVTTGAVD